MRMADIAGVYGARVHKLTCPWGEAFSLAEVRQALRETHPKVVCLVHGETSTGVMQLVDEIARCRFYERVCSAFDLKSRVSGQLLTNLVGLVTRQTRYTDTDRAAVVIAGLGG